MKIRSTIACLILSAGTAFGGQNIFFLHHSTGRNIISEGHVRQHIGDNDFWDHDYNYIGIMNPAGQLTGASYNIPGDNTYPDGLHTLWTTSNSARTAILANHQVIAFKSCYPTCDISSAAMFRQYMTWYTEIVAELEQYPDKVFVLMSPPPRHRLATVPDNAGRARAFADGLAAFDNGTTIRYFNLFDLLADEDNTLRYTYERSHSSSDSHPNAFANETVGPIFAAFLDDVADTITGISDRRDARDTWGGIKTIWSGK